MTTTWLLFLIISSPTESAMRVTPGFVSETECRTQESASRVIYTASNPIAHIATFCIKDELYYEVK